VEQLSKTHLKDNSVLRLVDAMHKTGGKYLLLEDLRAEKIL